MKLIKFLLVIFLVSYSISAQFVGPKISVSEKEYDFGTIVEGAIVSHEFYITNEGTSELNIMKVKASCGCTVAKPKEDKLEPGESTILKVTFNSTHKRGKRKNYVTIYTNDKTNEKFKILTTAKVLDRQEQSDEIKNAPAVVLSKLNHDFGTVEEGSVLELDIIVKNNGKGNLEIRKVSASCGCTAALMSDEFIEPGKSGNLHLELDTSNMAGKKSRTVSILSNDPINPRLVLTLFVNVKG
ncbi:MAG: DUF1573 domain-containing protein [Bacteroidota bacterium]